MTKSLSKKYILSLALIFNAGTLFTQAPNMALPTLSPIEAAALKSPAVVTEKAEKKTAVNSKIAYFNPDKIFDSSKEAKDKFKPLEEEKEKVKKELDKAGNRLKSKENDLKKMGETIVSKENEIKTKGKLLSADATAKLEEEINDLKADLQTKYNRLVAEAQEFSQEERQFNMYIMQKEQAIKEPIMQKIVKIVNKIRKDQGWDAILPIAFGLEVSERVDVTQEIINDLNKDYKPTPAKPAASSKPADKPAAKPAK